MDTKPEPVGAITTVSRPPAIASQACTWAVVGAAKAASNHAWVAGEKFGTAPSSAPSLTGAWWVPASHKAHPPAASHRGWGSGRWGWGSGSPGVWDGQHNVPVRLTDFWERMDAVFGAEYSRSWARDFTLSALGERTVVQAVDAGVDTREIWNAVCAAVDVPSLLR